MNGAGKSNLIWSVLVIFLLPSLVLSSCGVQQFECHNKNCIRKSFFCDGDDDCKDDSDERYCHFAKQHGCPVNWRRCGLRCVPSYFFCDGFVDCVNGTDEKSCAVSGRIPGLIMSKYDLARWFQERRKSGTTSYKWGHELHRTTVALLLSDYLPGKITSEEMAYELTIQLLSNFSQNKTLSSENLALYINALLVSCIDPRDFHGHDLVSELRKRVEGEKFTNPIEIIALCNAGDVMTARDVERTTYAYDSQHRPFWIEIQALSAMAMVCLSRQPSLYVDQRTLQDMVLELKRRQHLNGTVENLGTTAMVLQVLAAVNNLHSDFNYDAAVKAILEQQQDDGSFPTFLESYYILPALSNNSLVSISTSHCQNLKITAEDALKKLQSQTGKRIPVLYSVIVGQDKDFARTWRLKVPAGSTLYSVIETVQELDPRFKVDYNVFDGKPYPKGMFNLVDDPESGLYWFVYKKHSKSNDALLLEASPVDIQIQENEELILWYKYGDWNDREIAQSLTPAGEPPLSTEVTSKSVVDATFA